MSKVYSIRVKDEQVRNLERLGRQMGRSASEAASLLVQEGLRRAAFTFVDFRDSPGGRQAYVSGTGLAVWKLAMLLDSYAGNVNKVARHLQWPPARVEAARAYSAAYPEEIRLAREDNNLGFEALKRVLPQAESISASALKRPRREPGVSRRASTASR